MSDSMLEIKNIGIFLLLAAIVPGLVYTAGLLFYFPDQAKEFALWMKCIELELAWGIVPVILGLLLSSICFAFELVVLHRCTHLKKWFPAPNVPVLNELEVQGKTVSYLRQLLGQAFMHLNIWVGLLCIILLFVVITTVGGTWTIYKFYKLAFGIVVIVANIIVSSKFYKWTEKEIDKVSHMLGHSGSGKSET